MLIFNSNRVNKIYKGASILAKINDYFSGSEPTPIPDSYVIPFEDSNVKTLCVNNWGGNVVSGELTYGEAKAVTSLGSVFRGNRNIIKFNELVYFTGLATLTNGEFQGCTNLLEIAIPSNVTTIGNSSNQNNVPFRGCSNLSGLTILSSSESIYIDQIWGDSSYWQNSGNKNVPMIFPNRPITLGWTFGYADNLENVYFQYSTPPANLANADISRATKLKNTYVPIGSYSAYNAVLSSFNKTVIEYDYESDPNNVLAREREWSGKTQSGTTSETKAVFQYITDGGDEPTPPEPTDYSREYLTFVAEADNVSFSLYGGTAGNTFQYSVDNGNTWSNVAIGQTTSAINNGEKIMFKASGLTINSEQGIGTIRPSSSASVEGNIMSLAYGDNFSGQTSIGANFQFRKLFSAATHITSAENMVLPSEVFPKQCYSQMFQGCSNLVKAPKVIGSSAATFTGDYCFSDMFANCTTMTTAPELPMTSLGTQCYWYMIQGCTSLTTAPTLPATTVPQQAYSGMFNGCSNLNSITCLATSLGSNATQNWVGGVAANGTFTKAASMTSWSSGTSGIPNGWTVVGAT